MPSSYILIIYRKRALELASQAMVTTALGKMLNCRRWSGLGHKTALLHRICDVVVKQKSG